ncbi:MAG: hypothetical protein GY950_18040 [bacterium]|nr:hypothetical protein [bacterium]
MKKDNIPETDLAAEVIAVIVNKAVKKYKIDDAAAEEIVTETMAKHPNFLQLLEKQVPLKKILKTRAYDEVNTLSRRNIYHALRQYTKDKEIRESLITSLRELQQSRDGAPRADCGRVIAQLARTHVSTRERLDSLDFFYNEIFKYVGEPASILDVGCGMHPLLFPFEEEGKRLAYYAALDKDRSCISALETVAAIPGREILQAVHWNITDGWKSVYDKTGVRRFDVAFLMKLVPVVYRIERKLLNILRETPAQTWVLTGCKISMTKHLDIEKRERKIIKQFIQQSGKRIAGEFSTAEEFCIIVK